MLKLLKLAENTLTKHSKQYKILPTFDKG